MWETEEGLDFLASETLKARYLLEGEKDWNDICERVAKAIAITEEEYLEFKDLIIKKIFLPRHTIGITSRLWTKDGAPMPPNRRAEGARTCPPRMLLLPRLFP